MAPLLDSARQLADYATAFDFLGKLSGATTERDVVENVFDLFGMLFAPRTMVYLPVRDGQPTEAISRSSVTLDLDEVKSSMVKLDTERAWTPSGEGFDIAIGQGPTREIIRVEGVRFVEYREHYLNLALNVVPVLGLALTNAKNFQLLRDEQAKLQAALLARDMVLAVVSHDLRSPLASINLSVGMLAQACRADEPEDRSSKCVQSIRRSVARMSRLIEDLLDISRIEAGVFTVRTTECAARDVCHEALQELRPHAEARGIRVEERGDPSTTVAGDCDRVIQVLSNLIGNAVKFAPARDGAITVEWSDRGTDVLFAVTDNGAGISPEELPHVFDVYWQGRQKKSLGAGLGLAIARGIVEAHGGTIWAESVVGKGAAFYFTIPSARASA